MSEHGTPLDVGCLNRDELTATQVTMKTTEQLTGNVQQSSQVGTVRGYQPSRRMPQTGKGCQFKGNMAK